MKTKFMCILGLSILLGGGSLQALNIGDLFEDLWPKGRKDSGGLSFSAPTHTAASGDFSVVTFNIDGFPKTIGGNSNGDVKDISKILEQKAYDIVMFQELFTKTKHERLRDKITKATYPYRSKHFRGTRSSFGDGLLRFSRFAFNKSNDVFKRKQWNKCAGDLDDYLLDGENPDCLTEKGFTMARTYVTSELVIDVYNLHMDAGRDDDSIKAKRKSMEQLAEFINDKSAGKVVIVAGDYNLGWGPGKPAEHRGIVEDFIAATGLTFACTVTTGSLTGCEAKFNKPDHIAFRSNGLFLLQVKQLDYVLDFVDEDGGDLSDHLPLKADFHWIRK